MAKAPPPPNYPGNTRELRHDDFAPLRGVLFEAPPDTENVMVDCPAEHSYPPPWKVVLPFEFAPMPGPNGSIGRPQALRLPCPLCGRGNRFPFPRPERRLGAIHLFGDEAEQVFKDIPAYLYVRSFVALHDTNRPFFEARLAEAKERLRLPAGKPLHVADIRSPQWREEHDIDLHTAVVNRELCGLMEALGEVNGPRIVSATVFPPFGLEWSGDEKKARQDIRDRVLAGAMVGFTQAYAKKGWDLGFTLEAQTDAHRKNRLDASVERVSRGLRHDLGFAYTCHNMFVGLPNTVPKSASAELELADLVAYAVRRNFVAAMQEKGTELPLEKLGTVLWGAFTPTHFRTHPAIGFPWSHFYGAAPASGAGSRGTSRQCVK